MENMRRDNKNIIIGGKRYPESRAKSKQRKEEEMMKKQAKPAGPNHEKKWNTKTS
jgi:hypothetical protein